MAERHHQRPGVDPILQNKYRVVIEGFQVEGFSEYSEPEQDAGVAKYRNGDGANWVNKQAGLDIFNSVTLKRGCFPGETWLNDWNDTKDRRTVDIVMLNKEGEEAKRRRLFECFPKKFSAGQGDAMSEDGVVIETLELEFEHAEWVV
jgi:phage tail-like protein